jgi:hypothetical protein
MHYNQHLIECQEKFRTINGLAPLLRSQPKKGAGEVLGYSRRIAKRIKQSASTLNQAKEI